MYVLIMDYYEILNVKKTASDKDIKREYKKLVSRWHPDKNKNKTKKGKEKAKKMFHDITEAYHVLSDHDRRKNYDQGKKQPPEEIEKMQKMVNCMINGDFEGLKEITGMDKKTIDEMADEMAEEMMQEMEDEMKEKHGYDMDDDLLGDPLDAFSNSLGELERAMRERKGRTIESHAWCTLEDIYRGCKKLVTIKKDLNGFDHDLELTIPIKAGTDENTRLLYPDIGIVENGSRPGDIEFVVKYSRHDLFKRINKDLHITLDITLDEAKNGFTRKVMTISGKEINVDVSPLRDSRSQHRCIGYGLPIRMKDFVCDYGDLVISFVIKFR